MDHWIQAQRCSVAEVMLPCEVLDRGGDSRKVKPMTDIASASSWYQTVAGNCCTLTQMGKQNLCSKSSLCM